LHCNGFLIIIKTAQIWAVAHIGFISDYLTLVSLLYKNCRLSSPLSSNAAAFFSNYNQSYRATCLMRIYTFTHTKVEGIIRQKVCV
jgi:hypothetical protein